jgi:uncharacterized protein (DUF952 family)
VLIYKILLPSEWAAFETEERLDGSPFDRSSGFIHCSSRAQVAETALRVFPDEPALVVVALDAEALGDAVRWEAAPGHGDFPHVYTPLPVTAVVAVHHVGAPALVDQVLARE